MTWSDDAGRERYPWGVDRWSSILIYIAHERVRKTGVGAEYILIILEEWLLEKKRGLPS